MKAKLLVDSATDISKAEAESLRIGFLPNVFGKANGLYNRYTRWTWRNWYCFL